MLFFKESRYNMAKAKYKRQANGYFQAFVWDGTYRNGTKHYVTLRSKVSSAALEKLVIEHNNKLREREYIQCSHFTFLEYANQWLELYKSRTAINTIAMYKNIINTHLSCINCGISDVNRRHYFYMINNIKGDRTRQQAAMTFKQIIKSAVRDRLLPASLISDIFDDISAKVKYVAPKKRALTEAEKSAVFTADFKPHDKAFVYILYGCGLRRAEALALTKSDINLDTHELTVNKALAFTDTETFVKTPKTVHGHRTVPIPDKIYDFIAEYIASIDTDILFPSGHKSYITKSMYTRKWARIIKAMQNVSQEPIDGLTAHIFRHNYCASLCYMIPEISIPKIARLLGDTDKMVIEVYNHVIDEKEQPQDIVGKALDF
jgi:hypothetical protein|nr:MAG TPA: Integrase [Caudoviricetes sp.]